MGIDEEIQNIYYSIYNINITLANLDQGLAKALYTMDNGLDIFDYHVNETVKNVNDIQNNIIAQVDSFPNQWLYLTILLFVILSLLALNAFLIYYIIRYVLNRQQRFDDYRMWYLKNIMRKKMIDSDDDSIEIEEQRRETPPPDYEELESIYEEYEDQTPILESYSPSRKNSTKPVEYSTLI
ncbi:unnamed protein product [Caenorhabditis angaria]|uniref:Uncharacterized protein n=1 Tax=Caenorhabditis angaria TaxID=860376 RepID=A0A9P1N715_9PELO|nr:unnamed protein product [Caenorhabditis angaria]